MEEFETPSDKYDSTSIPISELSRPSIPIFFVSYAMRAQVQAVKADKQLKLPISELLALASLVHPSKAASDIPLAFNWQAPPLPPAAVEWAYGTSDLCIQPVAICPATCRPFCIVDGQPWKVVAEHTYHMNVDKMISCHARYLYFVNKHNKYPTVDEFLVYLYNRYIVHGTHRTLPSPVQQFCMKTVEGYRRAFPQGLPDVDVFKERVQRSIPLEMRARMETEGKTQSN